MVKTTIPNVVLAIAGHDPWGYGKELQSLIDGLGLTQHIRLVGFQSDIAAFLGAVDIFAFATRSEGFGQVVVEAMAAGKPMTVSNLPPLTEIMVHGETGLLADPENPGAFARAISCLSTNREAAQAMGARARERAQNHFTAERMTQETVAFYEGLVRGSSTMKAPAANHGYLRVR
jgi:glycosyltransferase involved in cell wall biosynthesis